MTIRIIVNKELKTAFNSWGTYMGYILFSCVCGYYSWLSTNNLFYLGQATMNPVFIIINWTQFFLIPALTMKSFAEEKRNGTLELILSKPIKTIELVWGKFLACWIITSLALLLTLPCYATLSFLGHIDHGVTILGYLGLLAMNAIYVSIGLFSSSLCRTSVTAFFISLGIGLCFQLLFGLLAEQTGTGFIANLFGSLSIQEHFNDLARGIFDSRTLIYFGSLITVFILLTKLFICKSRF
ncbi:MAG: ABC transporter permease [Odoribacter sp.]|nr:ABC transporter permease [Odoribacter sp.]